MLNYQVTYEIQNTVASQLRDLFSTPKGTLILEPDYGVDFSLIDTDLGYAFDVFEFKENIRNQIRKYIPRINAEKAEIIIKYEPSSGRLAVQVNNVLINISESIQNAAVGRS